MSTILSPNHYKGRRAAIRGVCLHSAETGEDDPNVAESIGRRFALPATEASAHVGVDVDSECRYVADEDTAWCAPGANADMLHIEIAGRAGQTSSMWDDKVSRLILERAAVRVATWCRQWNIPIVRLTDAQVGDGISRGICDHWAVTRVFKRSTHVDIGSAFPWDQFLMRIKVILGTGKVPLVPAAIKTAPTTAIRLVFDGIFGPRTKARFQQWAGRPVDSFINPTDWRAIQKRMGKLVMDGMAGPKTWTRIQFVVGAKTDGIPGPKTIKALQVWLATR